MKLLVAEDTKDMSRFITAALQYSGYTVDNAADGIEAEELLEKNGYDAVILDIMMPRKDGISVLRDMRASHNTTPVLLLTAKAEVDDRVDGLEAGADDYLVKPFAIKELIARVHAMLRRTTEYEGAVESYADLKLDSSTCEVKCENAVRLSTKEFELLQVLIKHAPVPLNTEFLLKNVWPENADADKNTVKLYIRYLSSKLEAISSHTVVVVDADGYHMEVTA